MSATVALRSVVVVIAIVCIAFVLNEARIGNSLGWRHTASEILLIVSVAILVGWLGGERY